jgi:preprotein translocase subunit Sss1
MKYFLPITINKRRLHVCHLEEQTNERKAEPTFSFIINNKGNDLPVFSIDADDVELISTEGYLTTEGRSNNIKLLEMNACIAFEENEIESLPTYKIIIANDITNNTENKGLVSKGTFNNKEKHFHVYIDKTVMAAMSIESFVVVICYKADNEEYSYAFKIHLCGDDNLIEAAMDFGSEASQIRLNDCNANMGLIKEFRKLHKQYEHKDEFWQGNLNDKLYKSIFFLHRTPDKTEYAEIPNKNKDKTHHYCPIKI